jgi:hypothetical protein
MRGTRTMPRRLAFRKSKRESALPPGAALQVGELAQFHVAPGQQVDVERVVHAVLRPAAQGVRTAGHEDRAALPVSIVLRGQQQRQVAFADVVELVDQHDDAAGKNVRGELLPDEEGQPCCRVGVRVHDLVGHEGRQRALAHAGDQYFCEECGNRCRGAALADRSCAQGQRERRVRLQADLVLDALHHRGLADAACGDQEDARRPARLVDRGLGAKGRPCGCVAAERSDHLVAARGQPVAFGARAGFGLGVAAGGERFGGERFLEIALAGHLQQLHALVRDEADGAPVVDVGFAGLQVVLGVHRPVGAPALAALGPAVAHGLPVGALDDPPLRRAEECEAAAGTVAGELQDEVEHVFGAGEAVLAKPRQLCRCVGQVVQKGLLRVRVFERLADQVADAALVAEQRHHPGLAGAGQHVLACQQVFPLRPAERALERLRHDAGR